MANSGHDHEEASKPHRRSGEDELPELERPLNEVLGIPVNYLPESQAPPIDEGRLRAYLRRELLPEDRDEVIRLVASFRSWNDALRDLLRRGGH
jgi:hypothetical protein